MLVVHHPFQTRCAARVVGDVDHHVEALRGRAVQRAPRAPAHDRPRAVGSHDVGSGPGRTIGGGDGDATGVRHDLGDGLVPPHVHARAFAGGEQEAFGLALPQAGERRQAAGGVVRRELPHVHLLAPVQGAADVPQHAVCRELGSQARAGGFQQCQRLPVHVQRAAARAPPGGGVGFEQDDGHPVGTQGQSREEPDRTGTHDDHRGLVSHGPPRCPRRRSTGRARPV